MQIPAAKIYFSEEDKKDISAKVEEILSTGQLTLGKYGKQFEKEFAGYLGAKYAVAVSSGTSALEIILRALDIQGNSVIIPTNTFFATPASVIHAGGKVIFADISDNLCLDPRSLEERITEGTRAVVIVHIGGVIPPQITEIQEICRTHNLFLIEDAAHAHGSTLNGKRAGTLGIAAAFSFYPTKVMTSGEGGMIVTDDEKIYQRALVFRDQGKAGFYGNVHTELGYNWRMSEIHAVIGLAQFHRLEQFVQQRRRIARIYDEGLKRIAHLTPLKFPAAVKSNYYKYTALLDRGLDRAAIKKELKEKHNVSLSGEVYELPCHLQPVFQNSGGYKNGDYPAAEDLCRRMICLPVSALMTQEETEYVIDSLREVLK
jgi:perosamine synthetase